MRFRNISEFNSPLVRRECVDNLVRDFEVIKYAHAPNHLSELERALVFGKSVNRYGEFSGEGRAGMGQSGLFDHCHVFKCWPGGSSLAFMMTMPYNTPEGFHRQFDETMRRYYRRRARLVGVQVGPYRAKNWQRQFEIEDPIEAVIVDDKYKVRENGDFAAIVATKSTLQVMGLMGRD